LTSFGAASYPWIRGGILAALLAGIFYSTLAILYFRDWGREDYNYGYMIPLVSLYLIWEKRRELKETPSTPSWAGFFVLLPGVALFWLGELAGEFFTLYMSLWLLIIGLSWMQLGWAKLKHIVVALGILLTMFPPPYFIHNKISLQLQLISSRLGVALIQAFGISAYREGNVIDLAFTQLQVVEACSGLRYLFPLIVMGLLLAYFYKAALWKKVVIVATTVPLTILINSLRIAATGVLFKHWGAAVAEGFFHGFSGWLIFVFALGVLLFEMWGLKKIFPEEKSSSARSSKQGGEEAKSIGQRAEGKGQEGENNRQQGEFEAQSSKLTVKSSETQRTTDHGRRTPNALQGIWSPQFVVAVVLLAGTLAVSQFVEFREKIPIAKPLDEFPTEVGEWSGRRMAMEQRFIAELDLSDYVIVDYADRNGKGVNFYVAYYESQRKGESIHSPETCLPGSGWSFRQAGKTTVPLDGSKGSGFRVQGSGGAGGTGRRADGPAESITINRAVMENAGQRQLSYFWFPQRGRVLTNAYQLKLFTFWDALTRQRTDGALVRLITPIYGGEKVRDAEERLEGFTRQILPILDQFIPN
jgi:exosortase